MSFITRHLGRAHNSFCTLRFGSIESVAPPVVVDPLEIIDVDAIYLSRFAVDARQDTMHALAVNHQSQHAIDGQINLTKGINARIDVIKLLPVKFNTRRNS